jgi:hypothetical protein
MLLLVTGLPSPGKTRFVDALSRRLGPGHTIVGSLPGGHAGSALLHVHTETDVEALVEGRWRPPAAAQPAELVVRVDWEPVNASVDRVLETLRSRHLVGA